MQRGLADAAGAADAAEQRAGLPAGHRLPRLESPRRAGLGVLAARQADLRPLPRRIGLAARNAQPQPARVHADVVDAQRHQFGAAQRAGEAEQQECAVAPAARTGIAGGQQAAQHRERQRGGLVRRPSVLSQQAAQRFLDVAVRGVPRQVVEAVHLADRRQATADRRRRVGLTEAGEIGPDRRGRGGHRHEAGLRAPGSVVRPVGLVGGKVAGAVARRARACAWASAASPAAVTRESGTAVVLETTAASWVTTTRSGANRAWR